ncbi:hypothetical protein [Microvirga pakistanensis]|uniref:hypothetical protein n=1 Tax=Microvirga pakistanensis TaxID=1682650 RepID=UPI001875B44F|nr:hypothetical protein [Microvirga pakistanensis]
MKKIALAAAVMFSLCIAAGSAEAQSRPGGCLKYGLGGAVAGHFAGGHRLKGALAGCALGIYQRRKYEREAREQNEIRNRIPERRRVPIPERDNRYDNQDRTANRGPLPRQERSGPYDDLGLDLDRGRRTSREQADWIEDPILNPRRQRDGYEPGGAFAPGQGRLGDSEGLTYPRRPGRSDPESTGSFFNGNGTVY